VKKKAKLIGFRRRRRRSRRPFALSRKAIGLRDK
jgi:hypothetical protein